jgi:hypothetical protein
MPKLGEIKNLLPELVNIQKCNFANTKYAGRGFNECLRQVAKCSITLDRENLAKFIHENTIGETKQMSYELADILISSLPDLIVVEGEK